MWTVKEAEDFWKGVTQDHIDAKNRLLKGIDNAIYRLANEDITDEYVVHQIRMELVRLHEGEINKSLF